MACASGSSVAVPPATSTEALGPPGASRLTPGRAALVAEHVWLARWRASVWARRTGADEEDLLSCCSMGLTRAGLEYDGRRGASFASCAWSAVDNAARDHLRRESLRACVPLDRAPEAAGVSRGVSGGGSGEGASAVVEGLDFSGLTAAQREALHLRGRGLSVASIASALGIPEGTVKRRLHDARRAVRRDG